jgi:hypothetical protein
VPVLPVTMKLIQVLKPVGFVVTTASHVQTVVNVPAATKETYV